MLVLVMIMVVLFAGIRKQKPDAMMRAVDRIRNRSYDARPPVVRSGEFCSFTRKLQALGSIDAARWFKLFPLIASMMFAAQSVRNSHPSLRFTCPSSPR